MRTIPLLLGLTAFFSCSLANEQEPDAREDRKFYPGVQCTSDGILPVGVNRRARVRGL